jgi:3-dehydroquinate dehydratase-2
MPKKITRPAKAPLSAARVSKRRWVITLIDGPNMPHLGKRDPRLFGTIGSIGELQKLVVDFGAALGVTVRAFASDHEGEILEYIHATAHDTDGYLVDPGGLSTNSQGFPHALMETKKPFVEVCFYNMVANNEISVFTPNAIGRVMGLRQYSYLAALLALVLALDDDSFLSPEAKDSPTVRRGGVPHVFKLA